MKIKGLLQSQQIKQAIGDAQTELARAGIEDRLCLVFRLSLEEILLIYSERFGGNTAFSLRFHKWNGDLRVRLCVAGEAIDPFAQDSAMLGKLLQGFRSAPTWRFKGRQNQVDFIFELYNTTLKNFMFSRKYTAGSRKLLALTIACQIISAVLGILAPAIGARIIIAYTNNEAYRVMWIAVTLLGVQLLRNLFLVISNQGYSRVYTRTLTALEKDLVSNVLQIESQCVDEKGSGLFIQRITGDTGRIASGLNDIADMVSQVLNYFGVLCAMFMVNPFIAVLVVIIIGIQCAMELWRTRRLYADDRIFRSANERFSGLVSEMVRGAKDVKLLNSEAKFTETLDERIEEANEKKLFMQKRSWNAKLLRWEVGELGSFSLIALLGYLISKGLIIPSVALIFYNYYTELGPNAVKTIGNFMDSIADFNISNERIHALLNNPEFPKERFGSIELASPKGEITFEHVDFAYDPVDGKKVLDDLCFNIRPGEMVGLVGKSGCGKSTILRLLLGFEKPLRGTILYGQHDVSKVELRSLRQAIGVVMQDGKLFMGDIASNITIASPGATLDDAWEAAEIAGIADDIRRMPMGMQTLLTEGASGISGGQRQRIMIARAVCGKRRILMLDEATSALDNVTQKHVSDSLDQLKCTRVVVAHRLSTVRHCDRIMVVDGGRIAEQGTYDELIAKNGLFADLVARQRLE